MDTPASLLERLRQPASAEAWARLVELRDCRVAGLSGAWSRIASIAARAFKRKRQEKEAKLAAEGSARLLRFAVLTGFENVDAAAEIADLEAMRSYHRELIGRLRGYQGRARE
jgi:uncharacterized protein (DUF2384 family)